MNNFFYLYIIVQIFGLFVWWDSKGETDFWIDWYSGGKIRFVMCILFCLTLSTILALVMWMLNMKF